MYLNKKQVQNYYIEIEGIPLIFPRVSDLPNRIN